ncbi:major centromere autoantigen B-like isoform X3 [Hyla sarda]|uniref:major centromere autoantigen B-like isoform X3 n=1 Tax=Hyla sarda TaxID=327740 RepID=UPI0024C44236|nr:major centromere autoantigen B-like isoform X3 [Hyla sarda]
MLRCRAIPSIESKMLYRDGAERDCFGDYGGNINCSLAAALYGEENQKMDERTEEEESEGEEDEEDKAVGEEDEEEGVQVAEEDGAGVEEEVRA